MTSILFATILGVSSKPLTGITICVDPGHPSENGSGTRGKALTELEVCWKMGLSTKQYLIDKGATVVLTKGQLNEKVTNRRRAELGNAASAHLVLRLHCDAAEARGFATYFPDKQGTSNGKTGPSLEVLTKSKQYAKVFHNTLSRNLLAHLPDRGSKTDRDTMIGARQGALTGSIFSTQPVILVELAVLTNSEDEAWIGKKSNQLLYSRALVSAVEAVFRKYPATSPSSGR